MLFRSGVWQPLMTHNAALSDQLARQGITLRQLQALPTTVQTTALADDRPVPAILTETAQDMGLVIRRLEPEGRGARLVLDDALFETVIVWLDMLETDHALRVTTLDLARKPAPGMVSATLLLER